LPEYGLERAPGSEEASRLRRSETIDLARRIGVISPHQIVIEGLPAERPMASFNAGLIVEPRRGRAFIYPRLIVGYYKYVSAIGEFEVPLEQLFSGELSRRRFVVRLIIEPSTRFDFWGAEDPRVYRVGGLRVLTYSGRTVRYFREGSRDRVLPVTAVEDGGAWRRVLVGRPSGDLGRHLVSDKDAFLLDVGGRLYLFHRVHTVEGEFLLLASRLGDDAWNALQAPSGELREVSAEEDWIIIPKAPFEDKIAWGPPPLRVGGDEFLFILHGVSRDLGVYRLFAVLMSIDPDEGPRVKAVTPRYIMEPRELYERFGDRPYTIFPCGAELVDGNILISYGAADYFTALATIPLDELFAELDRGRVA